MEGPTTGSERKKGKKERKVKWQVRVWIKGKRNVRKDGRGEEGRRRTMETVSTDEKHV